MKTGTRAAVDVIAARAATVAAEKMARRQLRRMARYVLDGWTPNLLRALADAGGRAGIEHWQEAAIRADADTLEAFLTAQRLAGK